MKKARKMFYESVFTLAKESEIELCPPRKCPNFPGNCPEYLVWGMICQNEGKYYSLCLSIIMERTYQLCGQCEAMANVAASNKSVFIDDVWNKCSLIKSDEVVDKTAPYPGCALKDFDAILNGARGRRKRK
jgi:hypothetical protein